VTIELAGPILERLAQRDDALADLALAPQLGIRDGQLATLVRAMEADVKAGCPAGRLYGESLSLALAAYVAGRYLAEPTKMQRPKGGLSRRQLERVRQYVEANLGSNLSLAELAGLAELSPQHFALAFRKSLGVASYRYVIRKRLSEAKRLLAGRRLSVAEVALTLGFSSQSHFTEAFRKAIGTTPKRYQQER
jgi:AraC family transcriptional regulator